MQFYPCCGARVKSRFPGHAPARAQYGLVRESDKRGRVKHTKGANLAIHPKDNACATLAFLYGMPFTNYEAERDLRMIKISKKISGCMRTFFGAEVFA